jgi:FKBP-type peptidyl-prolyl cis-trans isomerase
VESDSIAPLIIYYQKLGAMARGMEQEKALFELVKKSPGLGVLPSGVCYSIMKAGLGKRPQLADSVDIHLKGFFADGKLFEDTYPKNTPYHTSPNDVIPGIKEILQIMPAGSIWRVYIPAALAFADKGVTDLIPPYSPLIYEVELLNVKENSQK